MTDSSVNGIQCNRQTISPSKKTFFIVIQDLKKHAVITILFTKDDSILPHNSKMQDLKKKPISLIIMHKTAENLQPWQIKERTLTAPI